MAKDPAMLWYWNDWAGGTTTLSRHLKGCYIDLLHAEFNSGPLSLEEIKTVLGADFGPAWPTLSKKFKTDNGLFFNERLEAEKAKRQSFSLKQKERIKKRYYHGNTAVLPEENENENRNENGNEKKGGVGGKKIPAGFTDYENWSALIIQQSDQEFEVMLMREKLDHPPEYIVKDHLQVLARYPSMKPKDQNTFRYSLLKHMNEKHKNGKNGKPEGRYSKTDGTKFAEEGFGTL